MNTYRKPFLNEGEEQTPFNLASERIPIEGEPADVVELVASYANWLSQASIPKLFINAEPGAILMSEQREFCRSWPNQEEVTAEEHFLQEDSPDEIGVAIAAWRRKMQG